MTGPFKQLFCVLRISVQCCQKHQILQYVVHTSVANIYNNKTKMHSGPPPKPVNVYGIWMKVSTMHHFHTILQTHRTKCLIMLISTYVGTEKNREILYPKLCDHRNFFNFFFAKNAQPPFMSAFNQINNWDSFLDVSIIH